MAQPNRGVCFLHSDRMTKHQPVLNWVLPSLFPQDLNLSLLQTLELMQLSGELRQTKFDSAVKKGQVLAQMDSLNWVSW